MAKRYYKAWWLLADSTTVVVECEKNEENIWEITVDCQREMTELEKSWLEARIQKKLRELDLEDFLKEQEDS